MIAVFIVLASLVGLVVGSFVTTVASRFLQDSDFQAWFYQDEGDEPERPRWTYLPFVFFFMKPPVGYELRWYDKIPLIDYLESMWRFCHFQRLVPGSRCDFCQSKLSVRDRIPVYSWFKLGGRCRRCRIKIPAGVPFVELFTGVSFGILAWWFGPTWTFVVGAFMVSLFIMASVTDFKSMIIPDEINAFGYLGATFLVMITPLLCETGLLGVESTVARFPGGGYQYVPTYFDPRHALEGFLAGAGFLYLVGVFGHVALGTLAMGGGDIKLAGWVGMIIGWRGILMAFMASAFFAMPYMFYLMLLGRNRTSSGFTRFPYGPFICMGAVYVFLMGPDRILQTLIFRNYQDF